MQRLYDAAISAADVQRCTERCSTAANILIADVVKPPGAAAQLHD